MTEKNPFDWKADLEATITGYQSPITLIVQEVETKIENDIITAVQKYGISVDKEELLKALNYDRDQYAKGYADAKKDYERTWIKLIDNESDSLIDRVTYEDNLIDHNFYLIAHKDFGTPLKAQYHSDFPHFTFSVSGRGYAEFVYDGKITHYMELPELPWKEEE